MIGFIRGDIEAIYEDKVVIDTGSIGYNVYVPTSVIDRIKIGDEVTMYTYLNVREDAMNLFGFLSRDDLDMYKMLISVNGIGPKAALSILSYLSINDLKYAIVSGDASTISKANGIGKKTAEKIILELKDKIDSISGSRDDVVSIDTSESSNINEAVLALESLGYSKVEALKAVKASNAKDSVEDIIKEALKHLI